jgi:hypothetical protein
MRLCTSPRRTQSYKVPRMTLVVSVRFASFQFLALAGGKERSVEHQTAI